MKKSKTNEFNTSRHDIFNKMLKKIFTRADLKYEYNKAKNVWEVCIGNGSDLVSDCNKSYSPEYKRQFKELFRICLLESNVEYLCYHNKKKVDFSKDDVINNILEYLSSWGIILTNPFKAESERKLFAKLLYKYIVELLDVVFDIEKGDGNKKPADHNISAAFEKKICQLRKRTNNTDFSTLIYSVACKNDIDIIFDQDFDRTECNYALCISVYGRAFDTINNIDMITDIRFIETEPEELWYGHNGYYKKNDNVSLTFCDWDIIGPHEELKRQPFQNMIKGFDHYPFRTNAVFKSPQPHSNVKSFKVLNYDAYNYRLPRYFYFVTKISEKELEKKYSYYYDNPSLIQYIENKGIFLIKDKYAFTEIMHSELLLENTMNVLEDLIKIDVPSFFDTKIKAKEYISKLPDCFVNVNSFFKYLESHKAEGNQAIIIFIYSLSVLIDNLCHNIDYWTMTEKNSLPEEKRVFYITRIKDFLVSDQLIRFIEHYRNFYSEHKAVIQELSYIIDNTKYSSQCANIDSSCGDNHKQFYPFEYLKRSLEVLSELLIANMPEQIV